MFVLLLDNWLATIDHAAMTRFPLEGAEVRYKNRRQFLHRPSEVAVWEPLKIDPAGAAIGVFFGRIEVGRSVLPLQSESIEAGAEQSFARMASLGRSLRRYVEMARLGVVVEWVMGAPKRFWILFFGYLWNFQLGCGLYVYWSGCIPGL